MALILDDYSEISAHVWSDLGYLICSMHLVSSIVITNLFFLEKTYYPSCIRSEQVLGSYHLI